jgi:SAM-dependent methyltransferase
MVIPHTQEQTLIEDAGPSYPAIKDCIICRSNRLHYLFSVCGYRVVRCDDCGLLLINPQPSDEELARIYSSDYFFGGTSVNTQRGMEDLKQQTADLYLDLLERYRGETGGRLLDIGCGQGDFLVRAIKRGFAVTGVEYSADACAVASTKVAGQPTSQIIRGEVTDIPITATYDVCILSDLIEHVRNPRLLLERVHTLLRPGGTILVATPSLGSWSARLLRSRWMEFKAEHLFYFNSSTLQSLLIDCGFRQIIEQPGLKILNLEYITAHFARYKVPGLSPFVGFLRRLAPARLAHKSFPLVASGIVQLARKHESPSRRRLSIVMPVYNEASSFPTAFNRLLAKKLEGLEVEIVVVESNSSDGTRDEVMKYRGRAGVKIILEAAPRGKGHAVRAGLKLITGDVVIIQDADLEYDLEDYEALLEPILQNRAAFVLGARHGGSTWKMRQFEDQPLIAAVLNQAHWFFTTLINLCFGARLKDPFTMYKVFRSDCLYGIRFECDRFDFDWELVIRFLQKGYHPVEIPVNYRSRSFTEGKKVSIVRDPLTWLRVLLRLRLSKFDPLQEIERERAAAPRLVASP